MDTRPQQVMLEISNPVMPKDKLTPGVILTVHNLSAEVPLPSFTYSHAQSQSLCGSKMNWALGTLKWGPLPHAEVQKRFQL